MKKIKRHQWLLLYLSTIVLFAIAYSYMQNGSFKYDGNFVFLDWIYFSTVTITTLGYGEITPVNNMAKILVSFESLFGLFLLGMFLNGEAQNALDRRDKKYVYNALNHSFSMLAFVEEYFMVALGEKSDQKKDFKIRFELMANKLKYQPEKFNLTDHILDNIYWGMRHAVNDFRLLALESKAISDDAFVYVSAIITSLEFIEKSPIDNVAPEHRKGPESMKHKSYIAFTNAVILNEILNDKMNNT